MNVITILAITSLVFAAFLSVTSLRWMMGKREDDHLHYSEREQQLVSAQSAIAHKLDVLDRWKTGLLLATLLGGVAALGMHMYNMWVSGSAVQ